MIKVHIKLLDKLFDNRYMCALVIVNPEDTRIKELSKGTWNGFKGWIPLGGHIFPNSTEGFKA